MSGKNKPVAEDPDCTCFSAARKKGGCPQVRKITHPLRYYEFTQDEIKALEECDKESFYRRCIPFSALFASVTYAAIKYGKPLTFTFQYKLERDATKLFIEVIRQVKKTKFSLLSCLEIFCEFVAFLPNGYFYEFFVLGFLSRHPQFGVFPKLLVAVAVGHIYGRLFYIPICEKRLRCELPSSSHLGNTMKEHYERKFPPPPKK